MTPFEKAKELFKKYYVEITHGNSSNYSEMELKVFKIRAKTFALISVDEMINSIVYDKFELDFEMTAKEYFKEVRKEIEKL